MPEPLAYLELFKNETLSRIDLKSWLAFVRKTGQAVRPRIVAFLFHEVTMFIIAFLSLGGFIWFLFGLVVGLDSSQWIR